MCIRDSNKSSADSVFSNNYDYKFVLDNKKIPLCDAEKSDICYDYDFKGTFEIINLKGLESETEYTFEIKNKIGEVLVRRSFKTFSTTEEAKIPHRIYGQVNQESGRPLSDSVVLIYPPEEKKEELPLLASFTNTQGAYALEYERGLDENIIQRFRIINQNREERYLKSSSLYNQPVITINFDKIEDENYNQSESNNSMQSVYSTQNISEKESLLISTNAHTVPQSNSCSSNSSGGLRVQCNVNHDWRYEIDINRCPDKTQFRVGYPYLNQGRADFMSNIQMQIVQKDSAGNITILVDGLENGDNVNVSSVTSHPQYNASLPLTMQGHKVDSSGNVTERCQNTADSEVRIIFGTDDRPYQEAEQYPSSQELCDKFGENIAWMFPISEEYMKEHTEIGMSWVEGIMTDLNQMGAYEESVKNGNKYGMTVVLRICYKGNCNINNGTRYGEAIVDTYKKLLREGNLPYNGLYVHVGHNDVNTAEFVEPNIEAQFTADAIKVIANARVNGESIVGTTKEDVGIKMISSNFDVFHAGDYSDGAHMVYEASSYIDMMYSNADFAANANKIYAWAANDYMLERGGGISDVSADIRNFAQYLQGKGNFRVRIMATEFGKMTDALSEAELRAELYELEGLFASNESSGTFPQMEAILLFNSSGINPEFDQFDGINVEALIGSCQKRVINLWQEVDDEPDAPETTAAIPPSTDDGPIAVTPTSSTSARLRVSGGDAEYVLGTRAYKVSEVGKYYITSDDFEIAVPEIARYEDDLGELIFFIDSNGNGKYDSGEEQVDSSHFTVRKVSGITKIPIKKGVNLVSVSVDADTVKNTNRFREVAKEQGVEIISIGYYGHGADSGWKISTVRNGVGYSGDFNISTESGLLIVSANDGEIVLSGAELSKETSQLFEGWNFVSPSDELLQSDLKVASRQIADSGTLIISKWDSEKQRFVSFIFDLDSGEIYGDEILFDRRSGLFIKQVKE